MRVFFRVILLISFFCLTGCGGKKFLAPVMSVHSKHDMDHDVYVVQIGDTVSSIASDLSLTTNDIIEWNHLKSPYTLKPGMRLHLISNEGRAISLAASKRVQFLRSNRGKQHNAVTDNGMAQSKVNWTWPAHGKSVQANRDSAGKIDGLDINGQYSTPVVSAAPGEVVYSGVQRQGYGSLVIVQHQRGLLSLYEFAASPLVKKGQFVSAGEVLAKMGSNKNTGESSLFFQIRYNKKAVNPFHYLPSHV